VPTELAHWYAGTQEVISGQLIESRLELKTENKLFSNTFKSWEALDPYDRALALNPGDENAKFHRSLLFTKIQLATALDQLQTGHRDEALLWLEHSALISPGAQTSNLAQAIVEKLKHAPEPEQRS